MLPERWLTPVQLQQAWAPRGSLLSCPPSKPAWVSCCKQLPCASVLGAEGQLGPPPASTVSRRGPGLRTGSRAPGPPAPSPQVP